MFYKRFFVLSILWLLIGCQSGSSPPGKVSIGVVSLEESDRSIGKYDELKTYLGNELKSLIELEPTYNERQALEQIKRKSWDIVFAPPGLAAVAISQSQYVPIFPLEGGLKSRSILVVGPNSPLTNFRQLAGKSIALGQAGSATGYYFPLYNLYGLTLAEVRLVATPKMILEAIAKNEVAAGAMSVEEFNRHRSELPEVRFRILFSDKHEVPSGAILVSPELDPRQREKIRQTLAGASSSLAASASYLPNAPIPDYRYMIEVVDRVNAIGARIKEKPAPLYEQSSLPNNSSSHTGLTEPVWFLGFLSPSADSPR